MKIPVTYTGFFLIPAMTVVEYRLETIGRLGFSGNGRGVRFIIDYGLLMIDYLIWLPRLTPFTNDISHAESAKQSQWVPVGTVARGQWLVTGKEQTKPNLGWESPECEG